MKNINFVKNPRTYSENDAFLAHLPKTKGKEQLLRQLSIQLNFPEYFGSNWDALLDCLSDFHWINQTKIVIVHDEVPVLNDNDLRIYFDLISEAILSWRKYKDGKEHLLEIVFPLEAKESLNKYLSILPVNGLE